MSTRTLLRSSSKSIAGEATRDIWLPAGFRNRAASAQRFGGADPFLDLMALVQEAALEPQLWSEVAATLGDDFLGAHVRFGAIDRRGVSALSIATPSLVDLRLFRERYSTPATNPGLRFAASTPPLTVELREQRTSNSALVKLDYYNDIMRPADHWHAVIVNMHRDERFLAPLGVMRRRSQGLFTDAEVRRLHRLAPHLNRAIRVTLRLKEMEARADAAGEIIDRMNVAIVLTDAAGRVAELNRAAGSILDEADGLAIRHGVLRAAKREDGCRLTRLVLEAAGVDLVRRSSVMQVSRPSLRRPLSLVISPTRNAACPFARSHAVCIAFSDPERAPETDADCVTRLYGLTGREAAVAVLLLQGKAPNEVGAILSMTINTVRTHIRHVFAKTGVDRLSELMRVLLRGPGVGIR